MKPAVFLTLFFALVVQTAIVTHGTLWSTDLIESYLTGAQETPPARQAVKKDASRLPQEPEAAAQNKQAAAPAEEPEDLATKTPEPAPEIRPLNPVTDTMRGAVVAASHLIDEASDTVISGQGEARFAYRKPEPLPTRGELCAMLEAGANVNDIPPVFFVRLIWKESRFNTRALSPKGAQGIAQFMPATAAERGLEEPFFAAHALNESAELLAELEDQFGNLGLAAAAYNAGPGRVQKWLNGKSKLPEETRDYVQYITGRAADDWKDRNAALPGSIYEGVQVVQDWCRSLTQSGPRILFVEKPSKKQQIAAAKAKKSISAKTANASAAGGLGKAKTRAKDKDNDKETWAVQFASNFSKDKAQELLAETRSKHGDVLDDKPELVTKATAKGKKPVYAVQLSTRTRDAADALCSKVKKDGGSCMVDKN